MVDGLGDETLGLLVLSREHEKVHAGFVLAAGAASLGWAVTIFATNSGLHSLCRNWTGLEGAERDATFRARGVAGLDELREACLALGVRVLACDAGLRAEAIGPEQLIDGVEIAGATTFLSTAGRRIVSV